MVAKLVIAALFLAAVIALFGGILLRYLLRRAEMKNKREMQREELQHEERMELFEDDDL